MLLGEETGGSRAGAWNSALGAPNVRYWSRGFRPFAAAMWRCRSDAAIPTEADSPCWAFIRPTVRSRLSPFFRVGGRPFPPDTPLKPRTSSIFRPCVARSRFPMAPLRGTGAGRYANLVPLPRYRYKIISRRRVYYTLTTHTSAPPITSRSPYASHFC